MSVAERMRQQRAKSESAAEMVKAAAGISGGSGDQDFQRKLAGVGGMMGLTAGQSPGQALEQYRHNNGWVHATLQAKANRIASQPLKIAREVSNSPYARQMGIKGLGQQVGGEHYIQTKIPEHFKSAASNYALLDSHPLLDAIKDPNPIMVEWSLKYVTVFNLELTGKCIWLTFWDEGSGRLRIWPVPTHWCEPQHKNGLFSSWLIRPEGSFSRIEVPGNQVIYFHYDDPSNPLAALGTLQAQARAVLADEAVQESQRRAFLNGIWPGLKIKIGRLPDEDGNEGKGDRLSLNDRQRDDILDAIKRRYRGIYRSDEPILCDGFIEDVEEVTRTNREMAYKESAQLTKSRVVQGFKVNPVIMGEIEGANRASALVAMENFCENAINPMLTLMGQVITAWMGPMYEGTGEKLVAFFEDSRPNNPDFDLDMSTKGLQAGAVRVNDWRKKNGWPRLIGGDGVWFGGQFVPCRAEGEPEHDEPPLIPPPEPVDEDVEESDKPKKKPKDKDKEDDDEPEESDKRFSVAATMGKSLTKTFWGKVHQKEQSGFFA